MSRTMKVILVVVVALFGLRVLIGTTQWASCTGNAMSGAVLSFQHLGASPSASDCLVYALGRGLNAPPTTAPSPTTYEMPAAPSPAEIYGPAAANACANQIATFNTVFNQLMDTYGDHASFPGPTDNDDGKRYAATYDQLAACLKPFGVPPPSY
jgi:hypothetical protein